MPPLVVLMLGLFRTIPRRREHVCGLQSLTELAGLACLGVTAVVALTAVGAVVWVGWQAARWVRFGADYRPPE